MQRELLTEAGVEVDIAVNGREAVDKALAAGARYHAVLMDVQMPEMDGLEATRRIRAQFDTAALPIIAMTAHAMERERRRCLEFGMDDHVAKPIDPKELLETLARWVAPRPGEAMLAEPATPPLAPEEGEALRKATPMTIAAPARADRPEPAPESPVIPPTGLPDALPPFDLRTALLRLGGRQYLLRKIISGFHESFADAAETLDRLYAENRLDELERLAHTLKSTAATLDASELSEIASDLECTLHDEGGAAAAALIARLKVELGPALAAAALVAAADQPPTPETGPAATVAISPTPLDPANVRDTIAELRALLAKNSPKSRKLVALLSEQLEGYGFGEFLDAATESLSRFDFRTAETALATIAARLDSMRAS